MNQPNNIAEGLLAHLPDSSQLTSFRQQVTSSIEKNRVRLQRERVIAHAFWIFCAVTATAYLWFGPDAARFPRAPFLACIFFLWGGVELLKHYIQASRVETLKEIKQLQLQVLELQARTPLQK